MAAARDDAAGFEDDDLVGERDRRETVRDDHGRPAAHRLAQPDADLRLGCGIHGRRRVVEDQDPWVEHERARDREALALPAREGDAALADDGGVTIGKPLDELVRLREPGRVDELLLRRLRPAEREVLANRRREEEGILRDDADLAAQRAQCHLAYVDAVDLDSALADVVETGDERGEARLARAGVPDQRHRAPGLELEVDVLEHGPVVAVGEGDVAECDASRPRRQLACSGLVANLLGLVEHLEDALARRRRALPLADPHAEHAQREDQHRQVEVEPDEVGERERPVRNHPAAREQDRRLAEHRQE